MEVLLEEWGSMLLTLDVKELLGLIGPLGGSLGGILDTAKGVVGTVSKVAGFVTHPLDTAVKMATTAVANPFTDTYKVITGDLSFGEMVSRRLSPFTTITDVWNNEGAEKASSDAAAVAAVAAPTADSSGAIERMKARIAKKEAK